MLKDRKPIALHWGGWEVDRLGVGFYKYLFEIDDRENIVSTINEICEDAEITLRHFEIVACMF